MSYNKHITFSIVKKHVPNYLQIMDWYKMSSWSKCSTLFLASKKRCKIDWDAIAKYSKHIVQLVRDFPEKKWNWDKISENSWLTMDFIKTHQDQLNFDIVAAKNKFNLYTLIPCDIKKIKQCYFHCSQLNLEPELKKIINNMIFTTDF